MQDTQNSPIDIVIAWVDGSDPVLTQKRNNFLNSDLKSAPPGAAKTRFHSLNEVCYCVLSILKFASFVRKIVIVTDQQDPKVHPLVEKYFPERTADLRIVDHTEIFEGYEEYLPTFNSICISNMLWRIKGLSEQFVYFNDDIFLVREVQPTDWFRKGLPVLRGKWALPPYERLVWDQLKSFYWDKMFAIHKEPTPSFQVNQWNAARLLGYTFRYFRSGHTPLAMSKKRLKKFFESHEEVLIQNIKYRFRNYNQFNTVALANHLEIKDGNQNLDSIQAVYVQPNKRNKNYLEEKFNKVANQKQKLFLCVQSLELAPATVQDLFFKKMNRLLEIEI